MKQKTLNTLEFNKILELLMSKAESSLGREKIKIIKPLNNIELIKEKQKETDEALRLIIKRGAPPLYGIKSIRQELDRLKIGGNLVPEGLLKASDMLRVSRELKNYIKNDDMDKLSEYETIERLINNLESFRYIEDSINRAIISEEEIADDASPELKRIRRQIVNKNDLIKTKLENIVNSQNYQKHLQDNIVTVRDGRYVIPVKQQSKKAIPGLVHDTSASGQTAFIEPIAVVELNNELRELEIEERQEIERILKELSDMLRVKIKEIANNERILKEVDFIFAKGKLAIDLEATKPILNKNGYINLKKARHPLLDKKKVVPIDIYLGDEFDTLVITGPNTGGKTVTLKTVGLCSIMAQSGLHIPAKEGSEIAVFDEIYADIGDEQSIEQSLSTFSSHMINIVDILDNIGRNSLVLFDELGAGTDPTEGAALAMSILDNLLNKESIRTIATTHYSQLKLYALTTDRVKNASVEFDVNSLKPTYKLSIGVPGKSNAFEISKRLGLKNNIIDYAKELISKENIDFEDALKAIEEDRKLAEERRYKAEKLNEEIESLKDTLRKEEEKTKQIREEIIAKANIEARDIIRKAKESSELIIDELQEMSKKKQVDAKRMHEAKRFITSTMSDADSKVSEGVLNVKSDKVPKNLKVGESVEVLSLNQVGTVISLPDDKNNLDVQVGIMKVNVPLKSIRRTSSPAEQKVKHKSKSFISIKSKNIKDEIDLRGYNIEEAILELDKYIDDVYIGGLKQVYVIHGKGTGALREGLQSYFRTHKLIKNYRPGEYGEGGTGVTVLSIK